MGDDTKARMRDFFAGNLREDATQFEKCTQTQDAKAFQGRTPSSAVHFNTAVVKYSRDFPKVYQLSQIKSNSKFKNTILFVGSAVADRCQCCGSCYTRSCFCEKSCLFLCSRVLELLGLVRVMLQNAVDSDADAVSAYVMIAVAGNAAVVLVLCM